MSQQESVKTILLVEDEALIAMDEASVLKKHGYHVITSYTAERAIEAVDSADIDLILMDIDLGKGKMDGTEAAEIILKDRDIPVVFLSSHTESEVVEKTEKITSYGYVVKNSGETVLITSIKMAFKLYSANQQVVERERMIAREKERLQLYLDVAQVLIVALDKEQRITLLNPKGCAVLGYAEEEVLGKNWTDLVIPPEAKGIIKEVFKKIISGEIRFLDYYENRVRCRDGSEKLIAWRNSILQNEKGEIIGIFSSGEDITEQKQYEAAIEESEIKYRTLFENMAQGAFYQRADGTIVDCNPAVLEQFGLTKDQFLGRTSIHPEWRVIHENGVELSGDEHPSMAALRTGKPVRDFLAGVFNPLRQEYVWLSISAIPQFQPGEEQPYQTFVTLHDITEKRRKETELVLTLDATTDGIWKWNFKTGEMFFSPRYYTMLGYEPDEFPASFENWRNLIHPDDIDSALNAAETYLQTKPDEYENEFRMRTKSGNYRWIHTYAQVVERDSNGGAVRMIGNHADITDRKLLEQELRENEENFRIVSELTTDYAYTLRVDEKGTLHLEWASHRFTRDTGHKLPKKVQEPYESRVVHPEDVSVFEKRVQNMLDNREDISEYRIVTKSGEVLWLRDYGRPIWDENQDRVTRIIGAAKDITEEKQIERKMIESEEHFRNIYQNIPVMLHSIDAEGKLLEVSDKWLSELGYSRDEVIGRSSTDFLSEESKKTAIQEALPDFYEKGYVENFPYQFVKKNGEKKDVLLSAIAETDDEGKFQRSIAILINVTEKVKREKKIKFQAEMLASVDQAVITTDLQGRIIYFNRHAEELYGWKAEEAIGNDVLAVTVPEIFQEQGREIMRSLSQGESWEGEFIARRKDGSTYWVHVKASPVYDDDGNLIGILGISNDVTGTKEAEMALYESEERRRKASKMANIGYWDWYMESGELKWSDEVYEIFGQDPDKFFVTAGSFEKLIHPDDYDAFISEREHALAESRDMDIEHRIVRPGNEVKWVHEIAEINRNKEGEVFQVSGVVQDITEWKKTEQKLQDTLVDLRLAQKIAKIGNWHLDPQIGVPVWSDEIYTIYERDPALGPPHIEEYKSMYGPDQYNIFITAINAAIKEGKPYDIKLKFNPNEERTKWIHAICRPVGPKGESGYFLRGTIQDITGLKRAEEEKSYLMKELNHRVKNNLLMISSLVNLKNSALGEGVDLSDISRQIDAIRIVHEKLYQKEEVVKINLPEYVEDLLKTVFSFSEKKVGIEIQMQDVPLPLKAAVPIGLIINEMATNALKHGYGGVQEPVFSVRLSEDKEKKELVLNLGNNGAPFPENIELENADTLGLRLISALVGQIDGSIELKRTPHPAFTVRLPAEEE